jgi:hypothetical protein
MLNPARRLLGEELLGHIGDDGLSGQPLEEVLITVNQMLQAASPGQMTEQGEERLRGAGGGSRRPPVPAK